MKKTKKSKRAKRSKTKTSSSTVGHFSVSLPRRSAEPLPSSSTTRKTRGTVPGTHATGIRPSTPPSIAAEPRRNKAASNLYDLLGGAEGVLDLIAGSKSDKLQILETYIRREITDGPRADGHVKMTFGKMLAIAGLSEKDVYQLFRDRRRAETEVIIADAEPKLASQLVERASKRYIKCRLCGGTKVALIEGDDGIEQVECTRCNRNGLELVEGNQDSIELFFDLSKLKSPGGVNITNDNRSVIFTPGAPGTAPSPVTMIRSLEAIKDAGPKALPPPALDPLMEQMKAKESEQEKATVDAEVIND